MWVPDYLPVFSRFISLGGNFTDHKCNDGNGFKQKTVAGDGFKYYKQG